VNRRKSDGEEKKFYSRTEEGGGVSSQMRISNLQQRSWDAMQRGGEKSLPLKAPEKDMGGDVPECEKKKGQLSKEKKEFTAVP